MNIDDVTKQQWEAFKLTQKLAKKMMYDIYSPEAVRDSGLSKEVYTYIIDNRVDLWEKFEKETDDE
tara:strand:+ start:913 stop:1110 length:198 start_codon:yes stop_codon:yes gene_type:complete